VAPVDSHAYTCGEDVIVAKECEVAYNATLMALLWDATPQERQTLCPGPAMKPCRQAGPGPPWLNATSAPNVTESASAFDEQDSPAVRL